MYIYFTYCVSVCDFLFLFIIDKFYFIFFILDVCVCVRACGRARVCIFSTYEHFKRRAEFYFLNICLNILNPDFSHTRIYK